MLFRSYLLRLAELSNTAPPIEPKKESARLKRAVAERCHLPTANYRHALKFSDGSFENVTLLKFSELTEAQIAASNEATGKCETFVTTLGVS